MDSRRTYEKWIWLFCFGAALGGCLIEGEQLEDLRPAEVAFGGITVSCSDGLKNGSETDIDCGGSCRACDLGRTCGRVGDCESGVCAAGVCCNEACDGACVRCDFAISLGICAYVPEGGSDDAHACTSTSACDGKGACKALAGEPCSKGVECMSGMCLLGTCQ